MCEAEATLEPFRIRSSNGGDISPGGGGGGDANFGKGIFSQNIRTTWQLNKLYATFNNLFHGDN
jgi:hypothetical protein